MTMNSQQVFGVNMSKPNVILILTDQMRGDCLGINGNDSILTPFLDDLGRSGTNFTNCQSSNPSCVPARASILTGLPSHKTGFFGYTDGVEWNYKNTLVDELNDRGYHTINVGKTHFYPQRNNMNFKVNKLYDPQYLDTGFKSDYHSWLEAVNPQIEDPGIHVDNNGWPVFEWPAASYFHPTEWTLRTGIEEIEKSKEKPFFLQLSFHRPHPPLDPPEFYKNLYRDIDLGGPITSKWSEKFDDQRATVHGQYGKIDSKYYKLMKEAYYASITHIDYQVGRLVEYLLQNKLIHNTLIIFTSDHGEMLGDHNMFRKACPFRGATHVPFIVKGPSVNVHKSNQLITHIDIKPMILNYIDEKHNIYDGIDPLNGDVRKILHGEHPFDRGWHFLITDKYKFIWDSDSGDEWYFDVSKDINEKYELSSVLENHIKEQLRMEMVSSFKERNLHEFIEEGNLKAGSRLRAYERR